MKKPVYSHTNKDRGLKIVLIGSGNVATVLGRALQNRNIKIVQVYSKTRSSAERLSALLSCSFTNNFNNITLNADLYIIAVKDDAVQEVASHLRLDGKTVVHTSGSVPMQVLKRISKNCGVLYPAHGFNKKDTFKTNVPFCVEFSNSQVKKEIEYLVKTLSGKIYYMDSFQRSNLHLAAVFANNFTNHLWAIAARILSQSNIPYELLLHLVEDNFEKLKQEHPTTHQTGPAIRKDKKVMIQHKKMLKKYPAIYLAIYLLLSKSIQKG